MWAVPVALSGGVLLGTLLPGLPPALFTLSLTLFAFCLLPARRLRGPALFLLAACWCLFHYHERLDDRLKPGLAGEVQKVRGTVSTAPQVLENSLRFSFRPDEGQGLPETLMISWYRDWPDVRTAQQWRLELRLKPPWGNINFAGPDRERWLFAQGVGATGSVLDGTLLVNPRNSGKPVQDMRTHVGQEVSRLLGDTREGAVVRALATADRSGLTRQDKRLLRVTGTAHLLAISGLHIGLAAAGGVLLFRNLLWLFPLAGFGLAPFYCSLLAGLATAAGYALLANLGVSTVRALLMLLVVTVALGLARAIHPLRSFTVALAIVLLTDPFAPLGTGFWFSFLAVFALLSMFQPRQGALSWWKTPLQAQAAVFLFLLPAGAAWFNGFSLSGFAANLVAIPWVSFLVVPPVLGGIVALALPNLFSGMFWSLAAICISLLFDALEWLGRLQPDLQAVRSLPLTSLTAAGVGATLLMLPRGLAIRWLGLFLLLPLFLPAANTVPAGALQVDALDVGQGNAIAVNTKNHLLLYDTGPGDGAGIDQFGSAIVPYLSDQGRGAPDQVVISHGDLDHAGGLYSLRQRFPGVPVRGSLAAGRADIEPCRRGDRWNWDGLSFRVLHPGRGLPYLRNNSSCVLSAGRAGASVLLSGDIEDFVEDRLVLESLQAHRILIVPHHGSSSSSSDDFIDRVRPELAVASAALGNRFGFPRESVRRAYEKRGIALVSTGECGGIRVLAEPGAELRASSARLERRRIWRWPAAPGCP
jgi:competence protein ComEC